MSATSRNSLMRAKLAQHMLQKAQGFTLIELLVVIVIVGILSAVAIPTFLNQIRRARTAEAQAALTDVSRASEEHRLDRGVYPKGYENIRFDAADVKERYLTDPFTEKAPNYLNPTAVTSGDESSGVIWSTVANTAASAQYKNVFGEALDCRIGLGTAVNIEFDAGGPNLDEGCNLKLKTIGALPTPEDRTF